MMIGIIYDDEEEQALLRRLREEAELYRRRGIAADKAKWLDSILDELDAAREKDRTKACGPNEAELRSNLSLKQLRRLLAAGFLENANPDPDGPPMFVIRQLPRRLTKQTRCRRAARAHSSPRRATDRDESAVVGVRVLE